MIDPLSEATAVPALTRQQLVERDLELTEVRQAIGALAAGQSQFVVIEAAAGLGKTRLIQASLAGAREHDVRAMSARGSELEREFPFGIARQLLEPALLGSGDDERAALLQGAAALARPLFDALEPAGLLPADPVFPRLHGLYWLVANLASTRPLLLALDDAHWADDLSLRFLSFLQARMTGLPVGVIVAVRAAEGGAGRADLTRLCTAPEARVLRPRPLTRDGVSVLVAAELEREPDEEFSSACHEASAGNPFYLHALLRELAAQGIAPTMAQADRVRTLGPTAVSRAVLLRLVSLAPDAPALARAIAVLGDGVYLREAATLAGLEERRAGELFDMLVKAAICKRTERPEFVHPIVREAVYADLGPSERSVAHARAAEILTAVGASSDRVAAQLLGTTAQGDERVVDQLRQAARSALLQGAAEVASRYLRRALAEPPPRRIHAQVLLELGTAEAAAGAASAIGRLVEALELAVEPEVIASAAFELARALTFAGRALEAVDVLQQGLHRIGDAHEALASKLEALMLMQAHSTVASRQRVVKRLAELGPQIELVDTHPQLTATLALEKAKTGTAAEAARLAARAFEQGHLLERSTAESPAVYFAARALTLADRGDLAEHHLTRALADAGARGSSRGVALASCYRGWTRYRRGDLLGAEADLDAFMQLAVEYSLEMLQPLTVGSLIAVLVERGDHDAAARQLHAFETSNSDVDSVLMQELRAGSALLDLALGNPAAALDTALTIGAWEHRYGLEHDAFTSWRRLAARSHAALGDREQAVRVAAEAVDRARDFGARDYLGVALHVAATVGEQDGVCGGLADAIAVLEHSQARLEYARALIDLGAAHRRQGRRAAARDPLRKGLDLARECAASPLADRAAVELRAAGARPRDVVRSGLDALTASERRVAQLASEGLTNAQIAQALFVTTKTVETHLGHVYQKLDIRSRHQLPRI